MPSPGYLEWFVRFILSTSTGGGRRRPVRSRPTSAADPDVRDIPDRGLAVAISIMPLQEAEVPDYHLIFKAGDRPVETVDFSGDSAARALILAQDRPTPAELWEGDAYVTTLWKSPESGFWILYREPEVVSPRKRTPKEQCCLRALEF